MIVVQIAGRLGKDAETRFTQSGLKVTTLTMATNVRKAGKEETVWWRVTIWGERYDKMTPYFKKGAALVVVGEMNKPDIWTDKEGRPQVGLELTAEIVRFSPFGGSGSERSPQEGGAGNQATHAGHSAAQQGYGGNAGGDFNSTMQGSASSYAESDQSEEPIPF